MTTTTLHNSEKLKVRLNSGLISPHDAEIILNIKGISLSVISTIEGSLIITTDRERQMVMSVHQGQPATLISQE